PEQHHHRQRGDESGEIEVPQRRVDLCPRHRHPPFSGLEAAGTRGVPGHHLHGSPAFRATSAFLACAFFGARAGNAPFRRTCYELRVWRTACRTAGTKMTQSDPSADHLADKRHPLEVFFAPRSVAVIGASERTGSVGRKVMWNLVT